MAQSNHSNRRPRARGEPRRTQRAASADWWQDEPPVPYTGSPADPSFDDYNPGDRSRWAPGYTGEGNYFSGDYSPDEPLYDFSYAGFKGDVGFDELGDEQYGGGRYAGGPDEEANEFGGEDFRAGRGPFGRLEREFEGRPRRDERGRATGPRRPSRFPGIVGWRDAADWADPSGYRTFRPHEHGATRPGPKNYQRRDESILDEIYLRLLGERKVDSSDVSVEVHNGAATLAGTVPDRSMRYLIENIVASVRGVTDVDNRIRVDRLRDDFD